APLVLSGPGGRRARGTFGSACQEARTAPRAQAGGAGDELCARAVVAGALAEFLGVSVSSPAAFQASGAFTQHRARTGSTGKKTAFCFSWDQVGRCRSSKTPEHLCLAAGYR